MSLAWSLPACMSLGLMLSASALQADDVDTESNWTVVANKPATEARARLNAMYQALGDLHYEGRFVQVRGDDIATLEIVHRGGGNEAERISTLTGDQRELYRDDGTIACILPSSNNATLRKSPRRNLMPISEAALSDPRRYRVMPAGQDRVAGRDATRIDVLPRDHHRYGYAYWLDNENNMMLRYMVLDARLQPIEQLVFTNIAFPATIDEQRVTAPDDAIAAHDATRARSTTTADSPALDAPLAWAVENTLDPQRNTRRKVVSGMPTVTFDWLPDGYERLEDGDLSVSLEGNPVSHLMLSDGLSDVSIYVEFNADSEQLRQRYNGLSMMGALTAWSEARENYFLTVVGAVPSETVRAIARATQIR